MRCNVLGALLAVGFASAGSRTDLAIRIATYSVLCLQWSVHALVQQFVHVNLPVHHQPKIQPHSSPFQHNAST